MIGRTKIFLSSYSCKWSLGFRKFRPERPKSLTWFVDTAGAYGIDGVQIADNVDPERLADNQCVDLSRHGQTRGVALQWGFEGWDRDKVERLITVSSLTGGRVLRGVFGAPFAAEKAGRVEKAVRAVSEVLPDLERNQVTLAIENHFDLKVREIIAVIETFRHPLVRGILDTTNALGELMPPMQTVEVLAPYSVSMHFKDFKVTKIIGGYTILGVAVGEGDQDCMGILARALEINPEMEVCIELGAPWPADASVVFDQEKRDVDVSVSNTKRLLREFYAERG